MSEFTVLVLRLAFFVLLWLFVFLIAGVLRQDLFGPRRSRNRAAKRGGRSPAAAPAGSASSQPHHPPAAAPQQPHSLVVTSGALQGMVIALGTAPITIGRSGDNTLVLDDDFASGHHARFVPSGGRWYVEDLGSTNGTWLGSAQVSAPTPVPIGTPIRVGQTIIELRR